jgi:hypothetical protein
MKDFSHLIPSAATLDPAQMQARRSLVSLARSDLFVHSYYNNADVQHAESRARWVSEWRKAYGHDTNVMEPQTFSIL